LIDIGKGQLSSLGCGKKLVCRLFQGRDGPSHPPIGLFEHIIGTSALAKVLDSSEYVHAVRFKADKWPRPSIFDDHRPIDERRESLDNPLDDTGHSWRGFLYSR